MSEGDWQLFDSLCTRLDAQGRRLDELETRVESLLRESAARTHEAETINERPVLHIAEPEQVECPRCPVYHSPELPCPTPVDEAWAQHGHESIQI